MPINETSFSTFGIGDGNMATTDAIRRVERVGMYDR